MSVCACLCVCVRTCACVRVRVCARACARVWNYLLEFVMSNKMAWVLFDLMFMSKEYLNPQEGVSIAAGNRNDWLAAFATLRMDT